MVSPGRLEVCERDLDGGCASQRITVQVHCIFREPFLQIKLVKLNNLRVPNFESVEQKVVTAVVQDR